MSEQTVTVQRDLREERRLAARAFQEECEQTRTLVVRLLSSPGAGKTTLLQRTAATLGERFRVGILVGDVETERRRPLASLRASVQITTGALAT